MCTRAVAFAVVQTLLAVHCVAAVNVQRAGVTTRDSNGIRIVELSRGYRDALPLWEIAPRPDLIVGQVDGAAPYLLTRLAGATIRSDGSLAVADIQSNEIRFFDASGRFMGRLGRKGQGPGEFTLIHDMVRTRGDTLVVWDETGGRISWIGPDRELARVERRPGPRVYHVGALLTNGSRVLPVYPAVTESPQQEGVLWRPQGWVAVVDQRTGRIDTLGVFQGVEMTSGRMVPTPGKRDTRFATNGMLDAFAYGDNAAFDISVFQFANPAASARQTVRIREDYPPPRPTARFLRAWRQEMRHLLTGGALGPRAAREIQDPTLPETLPAFQELFLDDLGFLWVEAFRTDPGEARTTIIFNHQGYPIARAQYPSGLEILEIGRDYVLGSFTDALDVVTVRKHRLTRSRVTR